MLENKPQKYSCKPRNLSFTSSEVERGRGLGHECYQGSIGDICNATGKLCEVIAAYQTVLAQASVRVSEIATIIEVEAARRAHEEKHPFRKDDGYINPHIRD
jgi:hypothetical protein